jgi:hypothetical protein
MRVFNLTFFGWIFAEKGRRRALALIYAAD